MAVRSWEENLCEIIALLLFTQEGAHATLDYY